MTHRACSEARNTTTSATSSGRPMRPSGMVSTIGCFRVRGDPPSLDRSWGHHVHRDSILTELHGGGTAVGLQRRFAGSVGHLARKTVGPVRADIDDPAPVRTATDVPARVLGHEEGNGPAVDREVPIVATPRRPWRACGPPSPPREEDERDETVGYAVCGVVDQDIDRTQRLLDPIEQPGNGLRVGEVDLR